MEHHNIDVYSIPRDESPMYINEPWLIDKTLLEYTPSIEPESEEDNLRVYVPLDINKKAIIRRLDSVIYSYGEADEGNECDFSCDVRRLMSQVEIYDQIWSARHGAKVNNHSKEAVELVREFVDRLEDIPDGCAERFPFEQIDTLLVEYLHEDKIDW